MPRDFNIRFDNVEVIGGSDNLLENTNVTKVSMVGDNKMSSLGATFKNCKDLDIIEGSINLNGIDVINEILNGTQYVKSIRLENVNSPNISANLSFPHIENINFDKTYNKIAIQNVLGGCVWNIKDINYYGVVGNSVVNETVSVNNDINISILNSLEKTCREFEIHGNTFENLVDGMVERELSDGIEINMDNTKNVFPMKVVNNIRVDKVEGDSLFNLVDGEKVEPLDDSVNRVIINSDGTYVDNKIRKYDIFGMEGNTVQGKENLLNNGVLLDFLTKNNISNNHYITDDNYVYLNTSYMFNPSEFVKDNTLGIKLLPNTVYTIYIDCSFISESNRHICDSNGNKIICEGMGNHLLKANTHYTFTTNSNGYIYPCIRPDNKGDKKFRLIITEGREKFNYDSASLSDIQSVGELYVDDNNNPILDKDGNEQYKIDIINHGINMSWWNGYRGSIVNKYLNNNQKYEVSVGVAKGLHKYMISLITKIDFSKSKSGTFASLSQGNRTFVFDSETKILKMSGGFFSMPNDIEIGKVKNNIPFCISIYWDINITNEDNFKIFFNKSLRYSSKLNNLTMSSEIVFNSHYFTTYNGGCDGLNIISCVIGVKDDKTLSDGATDIDKINDYDIKSILLPFPLMRVKDSCDKLYWKNNNYFVEKNISIDPCIFNGTEQWRIDNDVWGDGYKRFNIVGHSIKNIKTEFGFYDNFIMTNLYKTNTELGSEGFKNVHQKGKSVDIVDKFQTVQELREYLTANNFLVYYVLNKPQLIKLNSPQYFIKSTVSNTNNLKIGRTELCNGANNIILKNGNKAFYDINLKPNTLYTIQLDLFLENDLTPSQVSINLGGKILTENITEDSFNKLIKITTNTTLANNNLTIVGEGLICQNVMLFETDLKVAVGKYVNGEQHVGEGIIDYFDGNEIEINNPQYKYKLENMIGNTWQDYNIPNSLKSVGELYVDSGGLPILDSEGKKQYKVDVVVARNENLLNISESKLVNVVPNYGLNAIVENNCVKFTNGSQNDNCGRFDNLLQIKPNESIYVYAEIEYKNVKQNVGKIMFSLTGDDAYYLGYNLWVVPKSNNGSDIIKGKLINNGNKNSYIYLGCNNGAMGGEVTYKNIMVARNPIDKYIPYQQFKKTILLPKQLNYIKTRFNGIEDHVQNTIIYDELYWDNDFNKYMIKENIKEYISPTINYNGSEFKLNMPSDISLVADVLDSEFIMDGVRVKGWTSTSVNTDFAISVFKGNKNCRLATTGTFTNLEVSQKLSNKKILYQTTKPKIIETNITEKLTFNDIDYFTPYTKFELDNFKSDIKLSNKYYLIDLKTSTYDIEGRDIVW